MDEDEDDALIASRAFAAKNLKVKTVEQLAELERVDLDDAIAAARAEDLSASAKNGLVKF